MFFGTLLFKLTADKTYRAGRFGSFDKRQNGNILFDVKVVEEAGFATVFRHHGKPVFNRAVRIADFDFLAFYQNPAFGFGLGAENGIHHFTSARPHKAGESEDFALVQFKGDVAYLAVFSREVLHFKKHFFVFVRVRRVLVLVVLLHLAPDHHRDEVVGCHFAYKPRADISAVFEDRNAVADFHNLAELVGNKDNPFSLRLQRADNREQVIDFFRG